MLSVIVALQAHPVISETGNGRPTIHFKNATVKKQTVPKAEPVPMGVIGRTAQAMASTAIANTLIVPSLVDLNDLEIVKDGTLTKNQASMAYGIGTSVFSGITNAVGEVIYRSGRKMHDNIPIVAKRESVTPLEAAALNAIPMTIISRASALRDPKGYMETIGLSSALTALVSVPVRYVTEGIAKVIQK